MRRPDKYDVEWYSLISVLIAYAVIGTIVAIAANKPPEKIEEIDCSIFDAMPILEQVRPFLDEPQPPEQVDFKTRIAYVDDWTKRRAMAAVKLDKLIEVCRLKLKESGD